MHCSRCDNDNPAGSKFCINCGGPLTPSVPPADATLLLSATQVARAAPQQRTYEISSLFHNRQRIIVGRAADCDLQLPHPSVSRYHARIERRDGGLFVTDLASMNGVYVAGRRVSETAQLGEGDTVGIGPFSLTVRHGQLRSIDSSRSLRLEARRLEKVITLPDGSERKLLDDINLVVQPGEFVTLLGPSGSGKSTLMDCLNGRRRATGGLVLANGEDFYVNFDRFRQSLGYVPQKDIVHGGLTVERALFYTARLRLPPDTSGREIGTRVEKVLDEMELVPHRHTQVANLSGGQIKRVSLGAELLGQPALLYIDEATSGLDAGTEARMMRLFRRLADEGRSLVCITHSVENVEQCHLVLVLARGKLIYYGPPREAPAFFGAARLSEIYDRIADRSLDEWEQQFRDSALHREYVRARQDAVASEAVAPSALVRSTPAAEANSADRVPFRDSLSNLVAEGRCLVERFRQAGAKTLWRYALLSPVGQAWHQFGLLAARYLELTGSDRRGLRLLLLQAPIVALFLLVGFAGSPFTRTMPRLRRLNDEERRALVLVREMGGLLDSGQPLTDAQKTALARIRVEGPGVAVPLDGNSVAGVLRQLARDDLPAEQRQTLEQVRFTFDLDGTPEAVSAADLLAASRQFSRARVAEQLLSVSDPVVPSGDMINPRFSYTLLFVVVMIVLWFGCNNAAKEIVKEEAIFARERAVNLQVLPYLSSKFLVQTAITIFHAAVLMLVLFGGLELLARQLPGHSVPPAEYVLGYAAMFGVLCLLAATGVALGLLLSACVSTPDRANSLLPYVLIPQMVLAGGLVSVDHGVLHYLALLFSPVYWAYRAVHLGANELPRGFPGHAEYAGGVLLPALALLGQTTVLLAATWLLLRRKDG